GLSGFRVIFTVYVSTSSTLAMSARIAALNLSSTCRFRLLTTSPATNSRPFTGGMLWYFTPWRSLSTQVWASACSQLVARSGDGVKLGIGSVGPNLKVISWPQAIPGPQASSPVLLV